MLYLSGTQARGVEALSLRLSEAPDSPPGLHFILMVGVARRSAKCGNLSPEMSNLSAVRHEWRAGL